MKLSDLLLNIEYTVLAGSCDVEISSVEYDSRRVRGGELFVCLTGSRVDGHDFAHSAYAAGCRAFVCERDTALPSDAVVLKVDDSRAALAELSAAFYGYPADRLHIIGVTGTKGKTTTALLIRSILEGAGIPCAYVGSNGVMINGRHIETVNTTPESRELQHYFAAMLEAGVEHAVIEVSSQALEHCRVRTVGFDVCIFTNLSPDHIGDDEHASYEEYRAAKRKLFTDYPVKLAVVNADDESSEYMLEGTSMPVVRFSSAGDPQADIFARDCRIFQNENALGIAFDCICGEERTSLEMLTPGLFSASNGLAAIAACAYYGVCVEKCGEILAHTSVCGRFEVVPAMPKRIFIIDYAHNGLSLTSALSVLRAYSPERLICVFGSVGGRTKLRRRELAEAASALADYCIITSDNPDYEEPTQIADEIVSYLSPEMPYEVITDRECALRRAVSMARDGDIVLFAGKGHERYQLICGEKLPFCERDIILDECRSLMLSSKL